MEFTFSIKEINYPLIEKVNATNITIKIAFSFSNILLRLIFQIYEEHNFYAEKTSLHWAALSYACASPSYVHFTFSAWLVHLGS